MELDLVDPLPEAVVRAQLRRVLVREPPPLERLAGQRAAEVGAAVRRPPAPSRSSASASGRFCAKRSCPASGGGWFAVAACGKRSPRNEVTSSRHRRPCRAPAVLVVLDGPEYVRRMRLLRAAAAARRRAARCGRTASRSSCRTTGSRPTPRRRRMRARSRARARPAGARRVGLGCSLGGARAPARAPPPAEHVRRPLPPVGQLLPPAHRPAGGAVPAASRASTASSAPCCAAGAAAGADDDHVRARRGELRQQCRRGAGARRAGLSGRLPRHARRARLADVEAAVEAHLPALLRRAWR